MINKIKSSSITHRTSENDISLDIILCSLNYKELSWFSDDRVEATKLALKYLKENEDISIKFPHIENQKSMILKSIKGSNDENIINCITTSDHYPTDVDLRPHLGTYYEIGDMVINSNLLLNKCFGWICTESGQETQPAGVWQEFININNTYNVYKASAIVNYGENNNRLIIKSDKPHTTRWDYSFQFITPIDFELINIFEIDGYEVEVIYDLQQMPLRKAWKADVPVVLYFSSSGKIYITGGGGGGGSGTVATDPLVAEEADDEYTTADYRDADTLNGQLPSYYATAEDLIKLRQDFEALLVKPIRYGNFENGLGWNPPESTDTPTE